MLPEPGASLEDSLEGQISHCELVKHQGKVPGGKLSWRRVRLLSLLILIDEFPRLSAMADMWPSIVLGCNFLSWKRYRIGLHWIL